MASALQLSITNIAETDEVLATNRRYEDTRKIEALWETLWEG